MPADPKGAEPGGRAAGFALAFASSIGLGLAVAVARIAFEGGTDGQSVATVRAWFVVLLVGLLNYVPALALGPVVEHLMLWPR